MENLIANVSIFIFGLILLIWGSHLLIQISVKISHLFKLTPLFIGIVFVAFGTSMPELAVSVTAALQNQKDIALGNVVGSNIANIALILGICAFLRPMAINRSIFKREMPFMILSAALLYFVSVDGMLSRLDGAIFLALFIVFCVVAYRGAKVSGEAETELAHFAFSRIIRKVNSKVILIVFSLAAIALVVTGAQAMVQSGVFLARRFGISPWIIGVTVFAIGTSLPELAASLTAAFKKVSSISVGNIVGSNIFNILLILGVACLIRPIAITDTSVLTFSLPVVVFFSFLLYVFMRTDYMLTRREAAILLAGYAVFLVLL